ncbi:uncharacterized protein CBL_20488 [Carabus blaptoides fortunei]
MQFETKFLLRLHLIGHTGIKRDVCKHCNRKFARPFALISHLATGTCLKRKNKYECTICKKIFYDEQKSMQHAEQHVRYKCTICNRIFRSEKYCKNHLKLVHGITDNA